MKSEKTLKIVKVKPHYKREIYELKMTTQNIKEELNNDIKNLRKKNQTEILEIQSPFSQTKSTVEGHSHRLEKVKDRISQLENKIEEKNGRNLSQTTEICERNMQELSNSIKGANLGIMAIEEEEVKAKGIHNIVKKIIMENFPNLKKVLPIQVQKPSRTLNRLDQNRTCPCHIIIKTISTENR
jgi:chromosome segregation ATPase